MRKIFTQETLKRSFKPSVFVALVCMLVWFWGENRKVDIDLRLLPEARANVELKQIDLAIYDSKDKEQLKVSQVLSADRRVAAHQISLRPGNYSMRGTVTTSSGHFDVEQVIVVPSDDATMDVFLRQKSP